MSLKRFFLFKSEIIFYWSKLIAEVQNILGLNQISLGVRGAGGGEGGRLWVPSEAAFVVFRPSSVMEAAVGLGTDVFGDIQRETRVRHSVTFPLPDTLLGFE